MTGGGVVVVVVVSEDPLLPHEARVMMDKSAIMIFMILFRLCPSFLAGCFLLLSKAWGFKLGSLSDSGGKGNSSN
jgi:hypothetical protein